MPFFLRKFKVLEKQFHTFIPSDTLIDQFEDFLSVKYAHVKSMNEAQFTDYMINIQTDRVYKELIQ